MTNLIFVTVVILLAGIPQPHARIQCAEIYRMTDQLCTWIDEDTGRCKAWAAGAPTDDAGAVLLTDSAGRMTYTTIPRLDLHCQAWTAQEKSTTADRKAFVLHVVDCSMHITVDLKDMTIVVSDCKAPFAFFSPSVRLSLDNDFGYCHTDSVVGARRADQTGTVKRIG
jgi:hypothetical protein